MMMLTGINGILSALFDRATNLRLDGLLLLQRAQRQDAGVCLHRRSVDRNNSPRMTVCPRKRDGLEDDIRHAGRCEFRSQRSGERAPVVALRGCGEWCR